MGCRGYEAVREGFSGLARIPEFVEEIVCYCVAEGANYLEIFMETNELEDTVVEELRAAFGKPQVLQQLPVYFSLQDGKHYSGGCRNVLPLHCPYRPLAVGCFLQRKYCARNHSKTFRR